MTLKRFQGILPAIASPCDENDVFQEEAFVALAEHLYRQGVHGLYVGGATGEGFRMPPEERCRAISLAIAASKEHNGVAICYVGANNSRDAIRLAEFAGEAGADAVASFPLAGVTQRQNVEYYTDIARAAGVPTLVYHVPILTGVETTVDEMLQWLEIEGVIGVKYTDWNVHALKCLKMARPDIILYNGFDQILTPGLLYGADGGIGTFYNNFPKLFLGIYNAVQSGNIQRAMQLQDLFSELMHFGSKAGIGAMWEMMMQDQGLCRFALRRPRPAMTEASRKMLREGLPGRIEAIEQIVDSKQKGADGNGVPGKPHWEGQPALADAQWSH